ncbi:MAG: cytochrome c [Pirellulales bacterium]
MTASLAIIGHADEPRAPRSAREALAKPPTFPRETVEVFFTDARRALGPKPDPVTTSVPSTPSTAAVTGGGQHAWQRVVSADVLEDEIKLLAAEVAAETRSASSFKSTGHKRLRSIFGTLAATFSVIGQFDGQVRWQAEAPGMRDLCARAARNLKAASDATLRESRSRGDDLAALIRGQSVELPDADAETPLGELIDRRGLMSRMEMSERDRLRPWLASQDEFVANRDQVAHEAAMLRLLADLVQEAGFEYADDETFREYADHFGAQCRQLLEATEAGDYEKARAAFSAVSQSCDNCHGDFRG